MTDQVTPDLIRQRAYWFSHTVQFNGECFPDCRRCQLDSYADALEAAMAERDAALERAEKANKGEEDTQAIHDRLADGIEGGPDWGDDPMSGYRDMLEETEDEMTDTVTINGTEYAPVDRSGERKMIVICDNRGLTFVGDVDLSGDSEQITIRNARCVIRWGTSGHLAELAEGPKTNTRLGTTRDVIVFRRNLVAAYECGSGWE